MGRNFYNYEGDKAGSFLTSSTDLENEERSKFLLSYLFES